MCDVPSVGTEGRSKQIHEVPSSLPMESKRLRRQSGDSPYTLELYVVTDVAAVSWLFPDYCFMLCNLSFEIVQYNLLGQSRSQILTEVIEIVNHMDAVSPVLCC